jgi:hypothetical protein
MRIRAQGVARGSVLVVTGAAALVLGVGGPAFADNPHGDPSTSQASDPDANGDFHSNCHTGSKGRGAGGEDKGENCQTETPTPPPPPKTVTPPPKTVTPPVQPGKPAAQAPAAQAPAAPKAVTPAAPAKVGTTVVAGPIPTAVAAGRHTTDSWTVPLGTGLVTLGAAGSAAALVGRRRTAQR